MSEREKKSEPGEEISADVENVTLDLTMKKNEAEKNDEFTNDLETQENEQLIDVEEVDEVTEEKMTDLVASRPGSVDSNKTSKEIPQSDNIKPESERLKQTEASNLNKQASVPILVNGKRYYRKLL